MIIGEKDVLLVDPQFSLSEAHRLAAELLESRKHLAVIHVNTPAPGSSVRPRGAEAGVSGREDCRAAGDGECGEDGLAGPPEVLGRRRTAATSRGRIPCCPRSSARPVLTLEGEDFPITGGVQGADGPGNSFVYIPSLKAVVTGDIVFDHADFGVPRDAARENWLKTIDQIAALKPDVVVPGHEGPGATRDHGGDRFHEAVHRRLGCQRQAFEGRHRDAGERPEAVPTARHGVHAQRPCRDLLSRGRSRARCGAVASNSHRFGDDRWPGFLVVFRPPPGMFFERSGSGMSFPGRSRPATLYCPVLTLMFLLIRVLKL